MRVVLLAGGTGGAKLAAGVAELAELTVIANTGDDVEVYGVHVSPDPDLVTYWLAGVIDQRGWGIGGDSFTVMDALAKARRETWFRLGDRDLAMCLVRTELLRSGASLTDAHAAVVEGMGVGARVLPMSDEPVRTHVRSPAGWRPFQEFMIVDGARGPIEQVELRGVEQGRPTAAALAAIDAADVIVIGPSNPIISIGPILAVPGMREAIDAASAPVVAVSPIVSGQVVKGPTAAFMEHARVACTAEGVASFYGDLLDAIITDEPLSEPPSLRTDTLLSTPTERRRVAAETLDFAAGLR